MEKNYFGVENRLIFSQNVAGSISELRRAFSIKFSQIEVDTLYFDKISEKNLSSDGTFYVPTEPIKADFAHLGSE